jgi:hypothetical protein
MAGNEDVTPRERTVESIAPWLAVIFSALAAISGIWTAWETRNATQIAADAAKLDRSAALVRACDVLSPARYHDGDDLMELNRDKEIKPAYLPRSERSDFDGARSMKAQNYLRCEFTNYSRVPLLTVSVYMGIDYNHHRRHKAEHNFPFAALAPGGARSIWIMNASKEAITVGTPQRADYARFPDLSAFQHQRFLPALTDYWVLQRDVDPIPTLDHSVML